jgi:hypothetical protein
MTEPVRVGEILPGVVAEAIERAGPGYDRWMEQVAATGYCTHPVRPIGDHGRPRLSSQPATGTDWRPKSGGLEARTWPCTPRVRLGTTEDRWIRPLS